MLFCYLCIVGKTEEFIEIMKRSELEKRLRDAGCVLSRNGSRHDRWVNPKTGKFDWVPRHSTEIATGTAHKILKKLDA